LIELERGKMTSKRNAAHGLVWPGLIVWRHLWID